MRAQIIMERSGDARHEFDPVDAHSIAEAKSRFEHLIGQGYSAVAFGDGDASGSRITEFDPEAERTIFIPRLVGG
ncbi:MAG: hypothetical protein AB7L90_00830 [Hyphomicrobiaceae bacterium]